MVAQATPQRVRPDGQNPPAFADIQGAPQDRGSDSRSHRDDTNGITTEPQRLYLDYDDSIREDLSKHRVYISFENGLKILLNVPENWKSGRHEYTRIISKIRQDVEYNECRKVYLDICKRTGSIETLLYEPQATLYNHTISLINKLCNAPYRKAENALLHFQKNHPTHMTQGIFTKLIPDITGKFQPLKDRDPLVWPMIVHIEETKDSDVALDRGRDGPRARNPGEKDPIYEHRKPCRKDTNIFVEEVEVGSAPTRKRKSGSVGFTTSKAPRTSKTPSASTAAAAAARSTAALTENQKTAGARLRCAHYLMEMLELSILRSHAFLTLVDRDHLQLMYADRSAIVTTSIIDLTSPEGETMFLAMLIAFHHLTPEQCGFLPLVENSFSHEVSGDSAYHRDEDSPTAKYDCLKGLTLRLQSKVEKKPLCLTLQEILYHQPGIIGRGTCVVGASCNDVKDWKDWKLAVKVSWPSESRESEISLLERARTKGKELIEQRQARRDALEKEIEKLQEDGKSDEAAASRKKAQDLVEESGKHWALNHLPNILHSEDFKFDSVKAPMPQAKLALFLSSTEFINGKFHYDPRALRISVQERLYKITTLSTKLEYAQAFYDVLICHRWMYDFPRILHRDISSGNIMYRIIKGKTYGVLNDLDLSSPCEHVGTGPNTSSQSTGTPPYMAFELLQDVSSGRPPIFHLYRHDLESFTYVILLLCSRNIFIPRAPSIEHFPGTPSIERLPGSSFDEWFNPKRSWQDLSIIKSSYLLKPRSVATDVHSSFGDFIPWLEALIRHFRKGILARIDWEDDMEAYESHVRGMRGRDVPLQTNPTVLAEPAPAGMTMEKPPPFEEETLNGKVIYSSFLGSISHFGGVRLINHNKDSGL